MRTSYPSCSFLGPQEMTCCGGVHPQYACLMWQPQTNPDISQHHPTSSISKYVQAMSMSTPQQRPQVVNPHTFLRIFCWLPWLKWVAFSSTMQAHSTTVACTMGVVGMGIRRRESAVSRPIKNVPHTYICAFLLQHVVYKLHQIDPGR